jgi:hypothetical protein
MVKKGVKSMAQNRKYRFLLIIIIFLLGMVGCGSNSDKKQTDEIIVSEPYSIMLYFEKKHSGDRLELRIFEANTKGQFDRLVNKYKILYDQENCLYKFDREFFKYNKVYIIHKNFYNKPAARKYMVEKNNDIIDVFFYEAFYEAITNDVRKGYRGDLIAVSKEFAKDVKEVRVHYKDYSEYDGE